MQSDETQKETVPRPRPAAHGLLAKALNILNEPGTTMNTQKEDAAIILQDGIYIIPENLETSAIKQDPALKALVDAVLR